MIISTSSTPPGANPVDMAETNDPVQGCVPDEAEATNAQSMSSAVLPVFSTCTPVSVLEPGRKTSSCRRKAVETEGSDSTSTTMTVDEVMFPLVEPIVSR